jgi:hypothetical protein
MLGRVTLAIAAVAFSGGDGLSQTKAKSFCADLSHVVRSAGAADRFASITGKLRDGSFHETTRPLNGWKDCTIYGERTYSCYSKSIRSASAAQRKLKAVARDIKACFGKGWWAEDAERTSSRYVVLHHPVGLATMTISTDEEQIDVHVLAPDHVLAKLSQRLSHD